MILTNPWATNPDSQITVADVETADIILVADGHADEVGNTVEIANQTGAQVVATFELAGAQFGDIPREQLNRTQPGSTVELDGISIRTVNTLHGSGGRDGSYGGPARGFFITFENGYTLFFSGSTDVTMDMVLWGLLFQPDAAILYYPGNLKPRDVAQMVRLLSEENPGLVTIIAHHSRVEPPAWQAVADLSAAVQDLGLAASVLDMTPGQTYSLPQ